MHKSGSHNPHFRWVNTRSQAAGACWCVFFFYRTHTPSAGGRVCVESHLSGGQGGFGLTQTQRPPPTPTLPHPHFTAPVIRVLLLAHMLAPYQAGRALVSGNCSPFFPSRFGPWQEQETTMKPQVCPRDFNAGRLLGYACFY